MSEFQVGDKVRVAPLTDYMHPDYDFSEDAPTPFLKNFPGGTIWEITALQSPRVRLTSRLVRERWTTVSRIRAVSAVELLADLTMFNPTEKDIGRSVVYTAYEGAKAEDGVITSMNDKYVFVRYKGDNGSKATNPKDLRWLAS
jgi:hypothetical protein